MSVAAGWVGGGRRCVVRLRGTAGRTAPTPRSAASHLTIGSSRAPAPACSVGRMERPRIWRAALLWAALVLPALTADRLGMNEPRAGWQQAAGLAVLAAAVAVARRHPPAAFALTAVLSLAAAPALFTVSYGPALGVFALLLGLRADGARAAAVVFGGVACLGTARIALLGVDPAPEWVVLTGTLLFGCVFPWLAGRYWRQSRRLDRGRLEPGRASGGRAAHRRGAGPAARAGPDRPGHARLPGTRAEPHRPACGRPPGRPDLPDHHRAAAADLRAAAADATDRLHRIIGVLREEDEPVPLSPPGRPSSNSSPAPPSRGCRCGGRSGPRHAGAGRGRRAGPVPGGPRGADQRGPARAGCVGHRGGGQEAEGTTVTVLSGGARRPTARRRSHRPGGRLMPPGRGETPAV